MINGKRKLLPMKIKSEREKGTKMLIDMFVLFRGPSSKYIHTNSNIKFVWNVKHDSSRRWNQTRAPLLYDMFWLLNDAESLSTEECSLDAHLRPKCMYQK